MRKFLQWPLTTTLTDNILTGAGGSALVQDRLKGVSILNKTDVAVTFTLYIGATGANAAGTEFLGTGRSIAARSSFEWTGDMVVANGKFLVGGASANTSLVMSVSYEREAV